MQDHSVSGHHTLRSWFRNLIGSRTHVRIFYVCVVQGIDAYVQEAQSNVYKTYM
jgi:hypothetical protein